MSVFFSFFFLYETTNQVIKELSKRNSYFPANCALCVCISKGRSIITAGEAVTASAVRWVGCVLVLLG